VRRVFPRAGAGEIDEVTWKAVTDICGDYDLPFLIKDGRIVTEPSYSTGTISIDPDGVTVTLTGGAWNPAWTARRLRSMTRDVYDITVTGATSGTLLQPWVGTSSANLPYTMFREAYPMPEDCDFAKEIVVFDVALGVEIDFLPYETFVHEQNDTCSTGRPRSVARGPMAESGASQLVFSPPPSTQRVYRIPYYRKPERPTSYTEPLSPTWPERFHDTVSARAVWLYADGMGHPRRLEFKRAYDTRIRKMAAGLEGGNELRRSLVSGQRPRNDGIFVAVTYRG